ncbi:L-2,4-diaminobutyrate decarboxylase [Enterobacter cancerogenus]|uniref:L-2,4-diaminobutyrate decarboxylase n=1 Tax=Enterobacter cancerogenus TaxID=69218 RepID=A0A484YMB9_9ENTR|nr:L-2,4-diaminobutyrate decarboxylase [Enterobacter cancerogenus]
MSDSNPILFSSAQSIDAYKQAIEQSTQAVMQWLKQPEMYQGKTVAELRDRIQLDFNPKGLGNDAAIERAVEFFLKDSLSVHHPQCVAHLHCPSLVVSQAAEVLINATNQSMDSWDQSPSATIIEIKLIEWLRTRVGYQAGDAGVFTSGGTQSNLMGLMLARDAFFARQGHSVQQDGLVGDLRKIRVLCSENAHFSVQKNMALMGLGYQSVLQVKTDEFSRMDLNDLARKSSSAMPTASRSWRLLRRQVPPMPVLSIRCVRLLNWRLSRTSGCTLMRHGAARC